LENKITYFDYAATTPMREEVRQAIQPFLETEFGNPSSIHARGREARRAVDRARRTIAQTLQARPDEIFFTSGGTESINIIHKGLWWRHQHHKNHMIISAIEHSAVIETVNWLKGQGLQVTTVFPNDQGVIEVQSIQKAIRPETFLVSVMVANNELGTIQPFREIGQLTRSQNILFHADAVQAYGKIPLNVQTDGFDFISVSSHKIYGPKGSGFYFHRTSVQLEPLIHGGGQERGYRGGTENVLGIVGMAQAAELIHQTMHQEALRLQALTEFLTQELSRRIPQLQVNGATAPRIPGIVNLSIPSLSAERLIQRLDREGYAISSGAACTAGAFHPSHVLLAMNKSNQEAKESIRISLGAFTTFDEIQNFVNDLPKTVDALAATPLLD
jgi:cysteine desulfurase